MTADFAPYIDTEIGRVSVPTEEIFSFAGGDGNVTGIIVYPYSYAAVVNGVPAADHYSNLNALPPRTLRLVTRIQDAERERRRAGTDPVDEVPIGRTVDGQPVYAHIPPGAALGSFASVAMRADPPGTAPYLAVKFETSEALDAFAVQVVTDIQDAIDVVVDEAVARDSNAVGVRTRLTRGGRLTGWGEIARDSIVETLRGVRHG